MWTTNFRKGLDNQNPGASAKRQDPEGRGKLSGNYWVEEYGLQIDHKITNFLKRPNI